MRSKLLTLLAASLIAVTANAAFARGAHMGGAGLRGIYRSGYKLGPFTKLWFWKQHCWRIGWNCNRANSTRFIRSIRHEPFWNWCRRGRALIPDAA